MKLYNAFYFLKGYETTASTICFILTMLALHPDVQEKTYRELISITDQTELIDHQKLQKLEYLERVINETLRLFPTVPMILRKCTGDVQFGKIVSITIQVRKLVFPFSYL